MVAETRNRGNSTRQGSSSHSPSNSLEQNASMTTSAPAAASSAEVTLSKGLSTNGTTTKVASKQTASKQTASKQTASKQTASRQATSKQAVSTMRASTSAPAPAPKIKFSKNATVPITTSMSANSAASALSPDSAKKNRRYKIASVPATPTNQPSKIPGPELAPEGYPFTFGPPSPKLFRGADETIEKLFTPLDYYKEFEKKAWKPKM